MQVASKYGGIDQDVRTLFFGLNHWALGRVLDAYEREYGKAARRYAEKAYPKWESGTVEMSPEVRERLMKIVPRYLTFDQKYRLIAKLWKVYRERTRVRVEACPGEGLEAAVGTLVQGVRQLQERSVPAAVLEGLDWVTDRDGKAARTLMNEVLRREGEVIAEAFRAQVRTLVEIAARNPDQHVSSRHTVELPGTTVELTFHQLRSRTMSEEHRPQQLVPAELNRPNLPVVVVQNPKDLLSEAIKHVRPEKVQEVLGTAADEALRLQVMQREAEIEKARMEAKLSPLVDVARRISENPNAEFKVDTEDKGKYGTTTVTIRSAPPPAVVVQEKKKEPCFVATACYGDYDHPTVVVLRRFRDATLKATPAGRHLVAAYYRHGSTLARFIDRVPVLKPPARLVLGTFAWTYSTLQPASPTSS
jgi:hypothetical protein